MLEAAAKQGGARANLIYYDRDGNGFQGVSGGKGEDGTVQYLVVLGQNVAVLDGTGSALGNTGWDMVIMGHLAR